MLDLAVDWLKKSIDLNVEDNARNYGLLGKV
eukprot:CAMPEP_0116889780 /NCGR_PEP_ID=MMETSP0467-20121206/318_1 /TAXON_ID=283647 /ORGANISM="Mesodinium pulex, Strain SPMC105" /LENGTH=30 /DNA_ID= /DNA_START= /DNA_END= /DNA_ORIENTATION=